MLTLDRPTTRHSREPDEAPASASPSDEVPCRRCAASAEELCERHAQLVIELL